MPSFHIPIIPQVEKNFQVKNMSIIQKNKFVTKNFFYCCVFVQYPLYHLP